MAFPNSNLTLGFILTINTIWNLISFRKLKFGNSRTSLAISLALNTSSIVSVKTLDTRTYTDS
jgi:hypothetical protein